MRHKVFLNKIFNPKGDYDLVRLGKLNDSGYLVDKRDVNQADILISLGVCHAWSFEEDFLKHNKIPVEAYDGTTGILKLFKMSINALLTLQRQLFFQSVTAFFSYSRFFSGSTRHHAVMVGFDKPPTFISLDTIFKSVVKKDQKVFLKIDIEGWEYRFLDQIIKHSDSICGLAIEFHDLDIHIEKVEKFIADFSLDIAHVHCNNYAMTTPEELPLVIEATFSSHPEIKKSKRIFPHVLDSSNDKYKEDYQIEFLPDL